MSSSPRCHILPQMKAKGGITLAVSFQCHQMAQFYPNLISSQPCSSHFQVPIIIAGPVLRFVRLITLAAPHSENWMLLTLSFFICGPGNHATFRGDAYSKHGRGLPSALWGPGYSACEASLSQSGPRVGPELGWRASRQSLASCGP